MKAILLGPNGQLGTDIRRANEAAGEPLSIVAIDRSQLDLTDFDKVCEALAGLDFDVLINSTGYHKTDEVEANAQLGFTINAYLVKLLAEISAARKARLVHISTDYVFGGQQKRTPLDETDGKAPVNVYGATKAMGEDLALLSGADVLVLRVAALFGVAGASGKGGNFVETMLRFGKEKGALRVVSDQHMTPTATTDIATSLLEMLGAGVPSGVWHVVNSGEATWHEFASEIIAMAGVAATVTAIPTSEFPTPAMRPLYSVMSNDKLTGAIGERRHWRDALAAYLKAKGHL